ncbi:phage head morphogenesis protein [Erwinia rhapontici]|nr:phage head morphogenesis protein [Erwinia rhapontici]
MAKDIDERYYQIKLALKALFDERMTGREREWNGQKWNFLCHQSGDMPTLYAANASTFVYDMTAAQISDLLKIVQTILDDYLLEGGEQDLWSLQYVAAEYERGTHQAFTNLSTQSQAYAQQTTMAQLLSSPAYQNQIAAAYVSTYSDWKGLSDAARTDLANVLSDAIGRGVNPRDTARVISKRLDVSMARAKNIAQTEQVGALRQAQWAETDWSAERLGLRTALLWISALKPTTRPWHASRHGQVYTTEEVRAFYAVNGNRYRCYCSQIPCLVDEKGQIVNQGLIDRLIEERKQWKKAA